MKFYNIFGIYILMLVMPLPGDIIPHSGICSCIHGCTYSYYSNCN